MKYKYVALDLDLCDIGIDMLKLIKVIRKRSSCKTQNLCLDLRDGRFFFCFFFFWGGGGGGGFDSRIRIPIEMGTKDAIDFITG